jgi:hypothetical protein
MIFFFHTQGEYSFLVFMSKEGLMEILHQMGSYLLNILLLKKIIYGKPNDACFLFVVESLQQKVSLYAK